MDYGELLLFFALGYAFGVGYEWLVIRYTKKKDLTIKGYKFHHSLFGAIFLAFGTIYYGFAAVGFGMIVHHVKTDGFYFITKEHVCSDGKSKQS